MSPWLSVVYTESRCLPREEIVNGLLQLPNPELKVGNVIRIYPTTTMVSRKAVQLLTDCEQLLHLLDLDALEIADGLPELVLAIHCGH